MIRRIKVLVAVLLLQVGSISLMAVNITTSQTVTGPVTYNELVTIVDNGNPNDTVTYIVEGDFSCLELTVQANTIMYIKGDLVVGAVNQNNVDFQVYGTLVVTGSLDVRGKNSLELNIETTGILVVGGAYDYTGKNGGAAEDNAGQMYLSDPDDFTGSGNGSGDIGDLVEAGVLPSDIVEDFVENVDETLFTTATWNGGSTQWDIDGNWTNTDTPTTGDNVFIGAGVALYPQFCSGNEYFMWDLDLESGAELVIPEGSKVTILGDVTIPLGAKLTVQNSNASPTSLIVYGDVVGNIEFSWTFDPLHWFFIGHPISNPSMANYRAILTDESNPNNKYALYDYQNDGTLNNLASEVETYEFNQEVASGERIKGYQLKVLNATTISQTGLPNNQESYSKQVVYGWQIIANPYPAYYQIPVGSLDFEGTEKTVYVSDSDNSSSKQFYTFNTVNGIDVPEGSAGNITDGIIAPGQAFYIQGTNTAESIVLRKSNLVHASGVTLKSAPKEIEENLLRIKLSNEHGLTDEAVIALFPDGDVALNSQDSKQMMHNGTDYSYIYSMVDGEKTVINVLPETLDAYEQPLGIKAKEGTQYLKISGLDNLINDYGVVLLDKKTGQEVEMTSSTVYEFKADAGEDHERFVLQFNVAHKSEVATDLDDVEDDKVRIYILDSSKLKIASAWDTHEKKVTVYTLSGSVVLSDNYSGQEYMKELNINTGVYIVKVTCGNQSYQQKVLIK
ncbi:T9SS type A sorting domain-containing protein [Carboxylicivirga litoralis]|uniref:T9SS type A sorting domain-containing protein n=1 Tax=Carboxylicivirga litoralis TaxID=2816963 RepID=UPI0021CB23DB|nr:T9SS type A sorting domain-containing protein [Carboxylicivirga sp. A043]